MSGHEIMTEGSDPDVLDAALISAKQRVEHYEIAGYGCARTYAEALGRDDDAKLLQCTVDEEGETDKTLTDIAESVVNPDAKRTIGVERESPTQGARRTSSRPGQRSASVGASDVCAIRRYTHLR
jgi:hypothetical protein